MLRHHGLATVCHLWSHFVWWLHSPRHPRIPSCGFLTSLSPPARPLGLGPLLACTRGAPQDPVLCLSLCMASLSLRPSRSDDGACVHVPILSGRVPQQPCQHWKLTCPELSPSVALPFLPPECPCPPVPTPGCHPDPSPPLSEVPTVLIFPSLALTTVVSHRATVPGPVGAPASGRVPPCLCPLSFPSTESVLVLPAQSSSVLPGDRIQIPQQGGQALPDSSPGSPLAPSQPHPTAPCASCHSLTQAPQLAPASPSVSTQWTPMQPPKCTSSRKSSPPSPASVRGLCTLGLPHTVSWACL